MKSLFLIIMALLAGSFSALNTHAEVVSELVEVAGIHQAERTLLKFEHGDVR